MNNALAVENLCKSFQNFSLKDISFTVPSGRVVGLVGENGSGKSTTVRCILGQDIPDSGSIKIFGKNALTDVSCHSDLGAAFESLEMPDGFTCRQISSILKDVYENWDEEQFFSLLKKLRVPDSMKIKKMSRGMRAKVSISIALSHHARFLIFDEATSGLDPVIREEILDQLLDFMQEETASILMTSHITSDIEKIADLILFIQDGQIRLTIQKEQLEQFGMACVTKDQVRFISPEMIAVRRDEPLSIRLLIRDRMEFANRFPDYALEPASLDDVILMYSKGAADYEGTV